MNWNHGSSFYLLPYIWRWRRKNLKSTFKCSEGEFEKELKVNFFVHILRVGAVEVQGPCNLYLSCRSIGECCLSFPSCVQGKVALISLHCHLSLYIPYTFLCPSTSLPLVDSVSLKQQLFFTLLPLNRTSRMFHVFPFPPHSHPTRHGKIIKWYPSCDYPFSTS